MGVTGGHNKSGFYEDGVRQRERFDNNDMIDQLEAKIRAKAALMDESKRIVINQLEK
jgi:(E)-4-hydroxy-3-methylbut-2-enyl-diphosphate synthase